jgi:calcineurin-like phosphoesterase family protein
MGNHDVDARRYYPYVEKVLGYYGHDNGYIMSHIPIHPSQLECRFIYNLHGHKHASFTGDFNENILDPKYFNVNLEFHDYKPLSMNKIKELLELKKKGKYNEYLRELSNS